MNQTIGDKPVSPCYEPDGWYLQTEGLFAVFYLVKPSRTMCPSIDDVPNFYIQIIKVAPLFFLIENILLRRQGLQTYKWNDSLIGWCAMIIAALPQAFIETKMFTFYAWLYGRFRLVDLPYDSMWTYVLCVLALELSLYVSHRASHEISILWASHQLHHSSEYFNLWSSARNSFVDRFVFTMFELPWAFLLPPGPARAHHQLNVIYQLWIHTLAVGNLGCLEYVLNSPTKHSIHHGRNRFCIDVNYGGFLSVYDQLFGTMVWPKPNQDTIYYGLVQPIRSWDIVYVYLHGFRDIFRRAQTYDSFSDRLAALWKGPSWRPGKPRLGLKEDRPEIPVNKEPYDKRSSIYVYLYCSAHMITVFLLNVSLVSRYKVLPWHMQLIAFMFILWTVIDVGYALEHKWFWPALEWTRCAMFLVVYWTLADVSATFRFETAPVKLLCATSVVAWTFNLSRFSSNTHDD